MKKLKHHFRIRMPKKLKGSHQLLASNRVTVLSIALNVISQLHKTVPTDVYLMW